MVFKSMFCKIKSCEHFKGVRDPGVHMFRFPTDPSIQQAWLKALEGQECCCSPYICVDHFSPEDYTISENGNEYKLRPGCVPRIFSVLCKPISSNDEELANKDTEEVRNCSLLQEIERLKQQLESEKIFFMSRINYLKEVKQKQAKDIKELNTKITNLTSKLNELTKEKDAFYGDMNAQQKEIIQSFICKPKSGQKYPKTFRQFCFTMHYHSPRAYAFLRDSFSNHFPHSGTIRSWYVNSDLNTAPNVINEQCLNILRRKVIEKAEKGDKLVCGVLFDEVHLRKHIGWSTKERKFVGYTTEDGNDSEPEAKRAKSDIVNQALVFIITAVNDSFELPIAYYFINSMSGIHKKNVVQKIIEAVMDCNVIVSHVTFDGFEANKKMCKELGAVLNVYSPNFKPYIRVRDQNINIFFDVCHMLKLIRNRLSTKEVLYESNDNEIRWEYFVDLVRMRDRGFELTHKMSQKHIEWQKRKMKVDIAAQTLSASTANSIEILMENGLPEFQDAGYTIKFTRMFNSLFDVMNTKSGQNENPLKRAMSSENSAQIFELFDEAIPYIKGLKVLQDDKIVRVCQSKINTGFNGFIINMTSLKHVFQEYVVERKLVKMLRTYCFQQDPAEIFFGKSRSYHLLGRNDNPTMEQFSSVFRKLLCFDTIMYSKFSNCNKEHDLSNPYSNILTISSKRSTAHRFDPTDCEKVTEEKIEELYDKLQEIEKNEKRAEDEALTDYTYAYIANFIEKKIKQTKQFGCNLCRKIFEENEKKIDCANLTPCRSTFLICKQTARFIKIDLMKGSINFNVIYHEILQNLYFDSLYVDTDFDEHPDHKVFLIRFIIDEFIRIKATLMARTATMNEQKNSLRVKLHKLLHFLGQ